MKRPHLLVCLSGHGYGHLGQTAPVLNLLPHFKVSVASQLPAAILDEALHNPYQRIPRPVDVGLAMHDALRVDQPKTRAAYGEFHRDWQRAVHAETEWLRALGPDLVLANVPYKVALAASRLEIPCLGLCSLNWADIAESCLQECNPDWIAEMLECYRAMSLFVQPEPSMPMERLGARRAVGPLSRLGLRRPLGPQKHVVVALGGLPLRPRLEDWPQLAHVRWIVPAAWEVRHPQAVTLEQLGVGYLDALASCDLLITKPGYGSFVEAACHGLPVLAARRYDWPEEECLRGFLARRGAYAEISPAELMSGDFRTPLLALLDAARPEPLAPSGVAQVVEALRSLL